MNKVQNICEVLQINNFSRFPKQSSSLVIVEIIKTIQNMFHQLKEGVELIFRNVDRRRIHNLLYSVYESPPRLHISFTSRSSSGYNKQVYVKD